MLSEADEPLRREAELDRVRRIGAAERRDADVGLREPGEALGRRPRGTSTPRKRPKATATAAMVPGLDDDEEASSRRGTP